jgi:hypothetical protein
MTLLNSVRNFTARSYLCICYFPLNPIRFTHLTTLEVISLLLTVEKLLESKYPVKSLESGNQLECINSDELQYMLFLNLLVCYIKIFYSSMELFASILQLLPAAIILDQHIGCRPDA